MDHNHTMCVQRLSFGLEGREKQTETRVFLLPRAKAKPPFGPNEYSFARAAHPAAWTNLPECSQGLKLGRLKKKARKGEFRSGKRNLGNSKGQTARKPLYVVSLRPLNLRSYHLGPVWPPERSDVETLEKALSAPKSQSLHAAQDVDAPDRCTKQYRTAQQGTGHPPTWKREVSVPAQLQLQEAWMCEALNGQIHLEARQKSVSGLREEIVAVKICTAE
ncbi:uncharacterized protein LOC119938679 [Tachyglossus aculeatus]|uniref:uncharacterized protein LOC119938679 n=1 Tax=Tachyglossus aculeatus TaxID=9261 RepID=UPI0018F5CA06|nr:uncharacterized protein LOC119938679 [Tachyglossus aculeatus]